MTRTLIAVGNEVHKGLLHAWAERVQILIELPLFIGFTAGTLEQVYLSPLPSWLIAAAGRVVAALAETAVVAAAVYSGVRLLVPLRIGWRPAALLPLLLVVLAVVGYSLLIGGLTLVWKRIEMLVEAQGIAVWVLSATALPLLAVPGWMATAGRLVPITPGLASLYEVMFAGRPASTLWGTGGLVRMLATTAGWLLAGILAFALGERAAKRRRSLGRY